MDRHPRLRGFNLFSTMPESMMYLQGLGQLRTMIDYHLENIHRLLQSTHIEDVFANEGSWTPEQLQYHDWWVDAMRSEMCAVMLLLRPQLDALAQIINVEVLGSQLSSEEVSIYRVYEELKGKDTEDTTARALAACFGEHLQYLDAFTNMIKHAPAMGFTHVATKPIAGGKTEHEFYFRPYDSGRLSRNLDLKYLRELKAFIDQAVARVGDALTEHQMRMGRLVMVSEKYAGPRGSSQEQDRGAS